MEQALDPTRGWSEKPRYLRDERSARAARNLFADAQTMLKKIISEKWLTARAAVGFFPANSVGDDDIAIFGDKARKFPIHTLHTLRQQMSRENNRPNLALADFIAPAKNLGGADDYISAFVSRRHQRGRTHRSFQRRRMTTIPVCWRAPDRPREAFASSTPHIRRDFWGLRRTKALSIDDLIAEKYRGIRPAPGYPAQPEHSEKATLFKLLDAEAKIGVTLTENYAMWPGSSVSGFYFSHPESRYFGVGKIERDQVADYAKRKGWDIATAERWLAPLLNYDPRAKDAA
jgi:5-methyltetrahydrofolate--homocysteine methyltransferase